MSTGSIPPAATRVGLFPVVFITPPVLCRVTVIFGGAGPSKKWRATRNGFSTKRMKFG